MKTYVGTIIDGEEDVHVITGFEVGVGAISKRRLNPCYRLRNHSPDGFAWGYGGSGPAQLALAILVDHTGDDEVAQRYYQRFKFRVIGRLPMDKPFQLTEQQVAEALAALQAEDATRDAARPTA